MEGHFTGSCHCGEVAFEFDGKILNVVNCHCSICRKVNGGAFSSFVVVPEEAFTIVKGGDLLTRYAMSDKAEKNFCSVCGAPVFNRNKPFPGVAIVALGCFDDPARLTPQADIFCADRLPWVKPFEGSKCCDQGFDD